MHPLLSALIVLTVGLVPPSLASASGRVIDADGAALGSLLSFDISRSAVELVTNKGYVAQITSDGQLFSQDFGQITYLGADCQGALFVRSQLMTGAVFRAGFTTSADVREAFYVAHDATALHLVAGETYSYREYLAGRACSTVVVPDGGRFTLVPVQPNDPRQTGISNGPFLTPLSLVPNGAFGDGFELFAPAGVSRP